MKGLQISVFLLMSCVLCLSMASCAEIVATPTSATYESDNAGAKESIPYSSPAPTDDPRQPSLTAESQNDVRTGLIEISGRLDDENRCLVDISISRYGKPLIITNDHVQYKVLSFDPSHQIYTIATFPSSIMADFENSRAPSISNIFVSRDEKCYIIGAIDATGLPVNTSDVENIHKYVLYCADSDGMVSYDLPASDPAAYVFWHLLGAENENIYIANDNGSYFPIDSFVFRNGQMSDDKVMLENGTVFVNDLQIICWSASEKTIGVSRANLNIEWEIAGNGYEIADLGDTCYVGNMRFEETDIYRLSDTDYSPKVYQVKEGTVSPSEIDAKDAYMTIKARYPDYLTEKFYIIPGSSPAVLSLLTDMSTLTEWVSIEYIVD